VLGVEVAMGAPIKSKSIYTGRNYDVGAFRDDHYLRCSRCGWINNMDQAVHSNDGGYEGWGTTFVVVTSTSGGSGYGPNSPVTTMQTPGPQGLVLYSTSLNSTDILVNSYGTFSFIAGGIILLNGQTTTGGGTKPAVMLLLFNGIIYYIDNASNWYSYGANGIGMWALTTQDPRTLSGEMNWDNSFGWDNSNTWDGKIGLPIEQTMDAVVGAGCFQCGTLLYTR